MAIYNYDIGGNSTQPPEAISDIPSNRTLIALQLTGEPAARPTFERMKNIREVFEYFKPTLTVEFADDQGLPLLQTFQFHSVDDFGIKGLTSQSTLLKDLTFKKDTFEKIVRLCKTNKALKHAMSDEDTRRALLNCLNVLRTDLDNLNTSNIPNTLAAAEQERSGTQDDLASGLAPLLNFGGFEFLESLVENLQNMNPERKARRFIFLSEASKSREREDLKKSLDIWITSLSTHAYLTEVIESCEDQVDNLNRQLKSYLKLAIEHTRELEASYRGMDLFYRNTDSPNASNITLLNATPGQLSDLDESLFIDAATRVLVEGYDRLDLRHNYSLLVVPGYLKSKNVLSRWAKTAHTNKVMLITDYENLENADDVLDMFMNANLTGSDVYLSNVVMTCNWLKARQRFAEVGEEEDLFISPSLALAGKMYGSLLSQVSAGRKFGGLSGVDEVYFDLKKSEIASLEKAGLVPMVNEYGKVMAFSAKTLYIGDNLGMQTYSLVRLLDYICKCLMDFLNRRAFENFNANTRKDISRQIIVFLEFMTGSSKHLDSFTLLRFEQDAVDKEKLDLDILLRPFFPAKTFILKLSGRKGDDGTQWITGYEQGK